MGQKGEILAGNKGWRLVLSWDQDIIGMETKTLAVEDQDFMYQRKNNNKTEKETKKKRQVSCIIKDCF